MALFHTAVVMRMKVACCKSRDVGRTAIAHARPQPALNLVYHLMQGAFQRNPTADFQLRAQFLLISSSMSPEVPVLTAFLHGL